MLRLNRRTDESVVIGPIEGVGDIWVTVLGIRGESVALGFAAPKDVRIDREEVRKTRNKEAAKSDAARAVQAIGGEVVGGS